MSWNCPHSLEAIIPSLAWRCVAVLASVHLVSTRWSMVTLDLAHFLNICCWCSRMLHIFPSLEILSAVKRMFFVLKEQMKSRKWLKNKHYKLLNSIVHTHIQINEWCCVYLKQSRIRLSNNYNILIIYNNRNLMITQLFSQKQELPDKRF